MGEDHPGSEFRTDQAADLISEYCAANSHRNLWVTVPPDEREEQARQCFVLNLPVVVTEGIEGAIESPYGLDPWILEQLPHDIDRRGKGIERVRKGAVPQIVY